MSTPPDPPTIGLPPEQFAAAFPFHFALDRQLRVVQVGRSLARLHPALRAGVALGDHLRIRRPADTRSFEAICASKNQMFILDCEADCRLLLRGQMMPLSAPDRVVFLGSPWLTSPDELDELGIKVAEFAIHDPVIDLLQLVQSHERAAGELRSLAEKLSEQKVQLREANAALSAEIAERERAAEELAAARDLAEEATRLKSEFLANMSHEIRTPLNGVLGMSELLEATSPSEEQAPHLEILRSSGTTLLSLVNDILDFSKIEAGRLELDHVDFDLRAELDAAIALVREPARAKGLSLTVHVDPRVASIHRGDPLRLRQVLLNLLGNAVKFTDQGAVELRVRGSMDGQRVRFEVADTGPGIALAARGRLFQPFTQADGSTTRRYGGTGLGLAISRRLVELMEGEINVRSMPNAGATFWFEVRLGRVSSASQLQRAEGDSERRTRVEVRAVTSRYPEGASVLIVEDHPANQRVAQGFLKLLALRNETASSGVAALEMLASRTYAAVLMDCQMPGLDGLMTTREIRRLEQSDPARPRATIIAMTANAMKGDRERCLDAGMDDYLAKPVRLAELRSILDRWIPTREAAPPEPPAPVEPPPPGAIGLERVLPLRGLPSDTHPNLLAELIALFLADTPGRIEGAIEAIARADLKAAARHAHAIKGSASSFFAARLVEACVQLERSADELDARRSLALIRTSYAEVEQALLHAVAA